MAQSVISRQRSKRSLSGVKRTSAEAPETTLLTRCDISVPGFAASQNDVRIPFREPKILAVIGSRSIYGIEQIGAYFMAEARVERRLAAILAADVAGYSRLMGADDEGTLAALKSHRKELIDPKVSEHRGRIVKTTGDGALIEFASAVDAVRCAMEIQSAMAERNAAIAEDRRVNFRIGINVGDVIIDEGDIYGDGVNIAARVESLATPGAICLSENAYKQITGKLALDVTDMGEHHLKNIAQPVRVYGMLLADAPERPTLVLPDKPSIAVLPFQNMSGDPEQEYFADGMVEEIITALSRIRWLFVIARNSSFTYKGRTIDVKQVGRELGVRYVLEGSVRKGGGRVRITAQLIEAETGAHLWADRFDGALEDVFDLQDKVAVSVAGILEPALQAAEARRSAARPTDLTAYDLYLRAHAMYFSSQIPRALHLLDEAIERDPSYGLALALAAVCCMRACQDGWSKDPEADSQKGAALARRALQVTDDDPGVLANSALALAYFGEDISAMMVLVDRALALNPSFARGWNISGVLRLWAGEPVLAIKHIEASLHLSPRGRIGWGSMEIGIAYFISHLFDQAVPKFLLAIQEDPNHLIAYRFLAGCYVQMGRLDEAREVIRRLRVITPVVVPSICELRKPEHRELYLSALQLAAAEAT
jgi:adenylate cyclase